MDEIKSSPPAKPSPLSFSKKVLNYETSSGTKYNTISGLERYGVMEPLSTVRPYKSDRSSLQPYKRPVLKMDSGPSPKPRNVTKIYT